MRPPRPRARIPTYSRLAAAALAMIAALLGSIAAAEDIPVFRFEMKDGVITPERLEVPAGTRFMLEVRNTGSGPAELESKELKKEVGVFPGGTSRLVIKKLDPGEYPLFDDFHPGTSALLIAK